MKYGIWRLFQNVIYSSMEKSSSLRYFLLTAHFFGLVSCVLSQERPVVFSVQEAPTKGEYRLGVRGSVSPLSWDKTIFFEAGDISKEILMPLGTFEYKYVLDDGSEVKWEGINNREIEVMPNEDHVLAEVWNKETPVDIRTIQVISSQELLSDYQFIEAMVQQVNPGTYRYSTEGEIQEALVELKQEFENTMSLGQAYLKISKVTAALKCDHTKVGFNNQNRFVNTVIHEQPDKLPFTFRWFDGKMIIDRNATDLKVLKRGVEVLSINEVSVSQIITDLLPYVAADGGTDGNRVKKLEVDGFDFRYNAFDIFFPLRYPVKDSIFHLKIKDGLDTAKVKVKGFHRELRAKRLVEKYSDFPRTRDDLWRFEIRNGVGVLTLNSFGLFGWKAMTLDYKKFLNDAFEQLKSERVPTLIIDIRKNTGGNDEMKKELFSFLPLKNTEPVTRAGRTRFEVFPEVLKPHIKTWGNNPWYYQLQPDAKEEPYYIFEESIKNRMPLPSKENAFSGNVFMLVGPLNTSLAFYTARDFQHYQIGKLIGEETGGNLKDINGGQILFLTLPNSGIEIDFPIMGGFTKENVPNSGVIPDIIVENTLEAFRQDEDEVMNKAFQLARE